MHQCEQACHCVTQVICIFSVSLTVGVPVAVNVAPVAESAEVVNGLSNGLVPDKSVAVQDRGTTGYGVGNVRANDGVAACPVPLLVIVKPIGAFAPESAVLVAVLPHPADSTIWEAVTGA